jgi:uncharacterized membrane-anchored protein YhcB (DUF1043 family)
VPFTIASTALICLIQGIVVGFILIRVETSQEEAE